MGQSITLNSRFIIKRKLKKVNDVYILPPGYIPNELGLKIINYCDGKHTIKDIVTLISEEYDKNTKVIKKDVIRFVKKLLFLSVLKVV